MEEMDVENEENTNEAEEKMDNEVNKQANMKADEESDSNVSDDDESESDISDNENADEAEVKSLESNLAKNTYDYGSHVALINKLQRMGELERLRTARENMSIVYPLSPELWLSWVQDEISCATTAEQKDRVIQLCKRAVKDYLCEHLVYIYNLERTLRLSSFLDQ